MKTSGTYCFSSLKSFTLKNVKCSGKVTVSVTEGGESVEIICGEKERKKLDVKTSDNSFEVVAGAFTVINGNLEFAVKASALENISVAGSVTLECTKTAPKCKIGCAGNVSADIASSCDTLKYSAAGSCKLFLHGRYGEAEFTGAGSVKLDLFGGAERCLYNISGSAEVSAEEFNCKNVSVRSSGASRFEVHASERLDINVSGSGKVIYAGNPEVFCRSSGGVTISKSKK